MDEICSALLKNDDLRVTVVTCTEVARVAQKNHRVANAAAGVLAQGLSVGLLMGSLAKERHLSRINVQLECDGPLRGLFVDADNEGNARGYVKNPVADVEVASAQYRYRPVLGNSGFISVLRDLGGGEYYRSSVELSAMELSKDFERYFQNSDQIDTVLRLEVIHTDRDALGMVGGLLIQPLPAGNKDELQKLRERLDAQGGFLQTLQLAGEQGAQAVLKAMFDRPDVEITSRRPVHFKCRCGRDRVLNALMALGKAELEDLLAKEGKAEVTCDFCGTQYTVPGEEIRTLLGQMTGP